MTTITKDDVTAPAAGLQVSHRRAQERGLPWIRLSIGRRVASVGFDAFFDAFELLQSDGSFVSSAANFHADAEIGSTDFVVRRFAFARFSEFEGHGSASIRRALSASVNK